MTFRLWRCFFHFSLATSLHLRCKFNFHFLNFHFHPLNFPQFWMLVSLSLPLLYSQLPSIFDVNFTFTVSLFTFTLSSFLYLLCKFHFTTSTVFLSTSLHIRCKFHSHFLTFYFVPLNFIFNVNLTFFFSLFTLTLIFDVSFTFNFFPYTYFSHLHILHIPLNLPQR